MSEIASTTKASKLNRAADGCELIAMAALVVVAAVQLWQVLARYVFNQSLAFSEPLSAVLVSTLLSFAAASAVHHLRHFRFSWLLDQLTPARQRLAQRVIAILTAVVCLLIAIKSAWLAWDGIAIKQAGIAMPVGSVYVPMSLAMFAACVFACAHGFARTQDEV